MRVFQAIADRADLDARSAVDFPALVAAGIMVELPQGTAVAAINTTPTDSGTWGNLPNPLPPEFGALTPEPAIYDKELFAEAALPMATLAGEGQSACGRSFYATVMSKPSTSPASDLKDLIAPHIFNLGEVLPTASFTPNCDGTASFSVTASGPDGNTIPPEGMTCAWTFKDGDGQVVDTSLDCSGTTGDLGAGSYTAHVVVTHVESECSSLEGAGDAGPITIETEPEAQACEDVRCDPETGHWTSTPKGAGETCREAAGECDVADVCDGTNLECPADEAADVGTTCGPAPSGDCDAQNTCVGTVGAEAYCEENYQEDTHVCRDAGDNECDVSERCTGHSKDCPADQFKSSTAECRPSAGVCDVAENCTGSSADCPADVKSTDECRAANGVCDVDEYCDGVNDDCPADGYAQGGECRPEAGACDKPEECNGESPDCPPDEVFEEGTVCNASTGICDPDDVCDGISSECLPSDYVDGVCRESTGLCDPEELCDTTTGECPADARGICGYKWFDGDTDGQWGEAEPYINGWHITAAAEVGEGEVEYAAYTAEDGFYLIVPSSQEPNVYTVCESYPALDNWVQTAPAESCYLVEFPPADADQTYDFGNVCIGSGGGHTLGFWSNKNGRFRFMQNEVEALSGLNALYLRNKDGSHFNPASYTQFRRWLLDADAINMAYMLSAQLAAAWLNVNIGWADPTALVYAPGVDGANTNGFITYEALIEAANADLQFNSDTRADGVHAYARPYQAVLVAALTDTNNDVSFVQGGICDFWFDLGASQ